VTLVKTLLVLVMTLGGLAAFTVACWVLTEALMRLCGKDPRV
jgi:hypothetical protein